MKRFFLFSLLSGLLSPEGGSFFVFCQEKDSLSIASWNVQNLFDEKDQGGEYIEFKQASQIWNRKVLYNKLEVISAVLKSMERLPDILIFQELEHPTLMIRFFERFLKTTAYQRVVGMDKSSVQVVLASQIPLERIETLSLGLEGASPRQAIKVHLTWQGLPLVVVGVHLKSWAGGETARSRFIRQEELTALGEWLESDKEEGRVILLLGDLNTRTKLDLGLDFQQNGAGYLGNSHLFFKDLTAGRKDGTYQGKEGIFWLDGVLLAGDLPEDKEIEIDVLSHAPDLVTEKGIPNRFSRFNLRGVSDHFPFLVRFKLKTGQVYP